MNSEDFVEAIKRYVMDGAIEDTIANLNSPPGRRVHPQERARSDWYNGLSDVERDHVNSAIATAAHSRSTALEHAVLRGASGEVAKP
ncbi:hypothetical protein AGMMS50243_21950 [Betaproteobacteria bacterium]|nr:hypothetical protein AGMMS50243_21950 [Betaproteobacteria bacterium]